MDNNVIFLLRRRERSRLVAIFRGRCFMENLRCGQRHLSQEDNLRLPPLLRSSRADLSNKKMTVVSIFHSILNEKMLNFWFEKCIFEQKNRQNLSIFWKMNCRR